MISPHLPSQKSEPKQDETDEQPDPMALQHFMDGQFYMNDGNYSMAIIEFQDALMYDSTVSTIHLSLGEGYWHLGKPDRAEYHLKKAVSLDPDDQEAREMLAGQFLMTSQFESAKKQFLILCDKFPDDINYILALADIEKVNKNYLKAISYYEHAFELDEQSPVPLEAIVEIQLNQKDFTSAILTLKKLISVDPGNLHYKQALADVAIANGDLVIGLEALQSLIAEGGLDIEIFSQIGWLQYEMKQPDAAIETFLDVIDIDSTHQEALNALSVIFREQENIADGKYFSERMIKNDSTDPRGYINAGLAGAVDDDNQYIVDILSPVSDRFNDDYLVQYLLGAGYESLEEYENAIHHMNAALAVQPDSKMVTHSLAMIYDVVGQWSKSDSMYVQLIEADSTDAQAYNNYAYSLIERNGDAELAKQLSEKAISLEPESAAYLDTYGWILYKMNNIETAYEYVKKSIEIEDTNSVVLEHLGDILFDLGELDEAKKYYQLALEINPENVLLKEKLARD